MAVQKLDELREAARQERFTQLDALRLDELAVIASKSGVAPQSAFVSSERKKAFIQRMLAQVDLDAQERDAVLMR